MLTTLLHRPEREMQSKSHRSSLGSPPRASVPRCVDPSRCHTPRASLCTIASRRSAPRASQSEAERSEHRFLTPVLGSLRPQIAPPHPRLLSFAPALPTHTARMSSSGDSRSITLVGDWLEAEARDKADFKDTATELNALVQKK